CQNYINSPITF
nr:immunoglobulin light chain junction region [Macaca mulatta]MOW14720.1 immunoglobulin light chain junction region [Macaca mulatta]